MGGIRNLPILHGQANETVFYLKKTDNGLIDCHSLEAIRYKQAKQAENSQVQCSHSCLVLQLDICLVNPTNFDNAATVFWHSKQSDANMNSFVYQSISR